MLEFATQTENLWFSIALTVMFGIALLEGIMTLFGMALSSLLDTLLPDFDADVGVDAGDVEIQSPNGLSRLLGWLRFGKVPVLMLLVIFLTGFGLGGLLLQSLFQSVFGFLLPGFIAAIPAFMLALPVVRVIGGGVAYLMPDEETEAVKEDSLIGHTATITLGEAKTGSPAEAKVKDKFGTMHYLMVEPDVADQVFAAGDDVLLVKRQGHTFRVIAVDNQNLAD
jgi:hypothetical protein